MIDVSIEFSPVEKAVKFNDSKEGFFAVRVHPNLRGKPETEGAPRGFMTNSTGQTGAGIWGKRARWVDYSGEINGQQCGVAIFDHPSNLRHPTTWHARDYGLLAANPFGAHYFQKKPKSTGQYELKPGHPLQFNYRVLLHSGVWGKRDIEIIFRDFADSQNKKQP